MKLALVTCDKYAVTSAAADDWYVQNLLREDVLLSTALAAYACQCERISWSDPAVDWRAFDAAIIRTTWDYFHRFEQFDRWLDHVTTQTRLCNPLSTVRWNIDKHYLQDLERSGLDIVPSVFFEAGSPDKLVETLEQRDWHEAVIKPCISGGARHTYRINRDNAAEIEMQIKELRLAEAFMVQPFLQSIIDHGEDTLVMAGDTFTHAVRKQAKPGDFRVQDDHGGTVSASQATDEQIEIAIATMRACQALPAYGRVDLARGQDGRWLIMELELIEPELWMRFSPPSAQHIARAIVQSL